MNRTACFGVHKLSGLGIFALALSLAQICGAAPIVMDLGIKSQSGSSLTPPRYRQVAFIQSPSHEVIWNTPTPPSQTGIGAAGTTQSVNAANAASFGLNWNDFKQAILEMSAGTGDWTAKVQVVCNIDGSTSNSCGAIQNPTPVLSLPTAGMTVTDVNQVDFTLLTYETRPSNFSTTFQAKIYAQAVPEPASLVTLLFGGMTLLLATQRKRRPLG